MRRIVSAVRIGIVVIVTIVSLTVAARGAEPMKTDTRDRGELYPLLPLAEGRWQVFAVSRAWLRTHWQGPAITALYFALLSPTPKAIEDDVGPCASPARLVAVITREGQSTTEVPLEYYDFCSPRVAKVHTDWPAGPQIFVEGIAVRLASDGQVEIEQAFRRHTDAPYPVDKSPATFPRPSTQVVLTSKRMVALEELYRVFN
jgi:hypothetical protein